MISETKKAEIERGVKTAGLISAFGLISFVIACFVIVVLPMWSAANALFYCLLVVAAICFELGAFKRVALARDMAFAWPVTA